MTKKEKKKVSEKQIVEAVTPEDKLKKIKLSISHILHRKTKVKGKTPSQSDFLSDLESKSVIICSGRPGTGKTYLTLAKSLDLLFDENTPYTKIYIFKSVTTLLGEDVGYMPGDAKEKMYYPLLSYMLNLGELITAEQVDQLIEKRFINIVPLAFARGLNLANAIVIGDECQNISISNMRTLMTRIADTSKLILLGDTNQTDMKDNSKSSLKMLREYFKDKHNDIAVHEFTLDDIQRNPLIKVIETIFDSYEANNNKINKRINLND